MRKQTILVHLIAVVFATACDSSTVPVEEDGDDVAAGGKADTGGIEEESPEAASILKLVNFATVQKFRDEVGLSEEAANNLIAYRIGDDEMPGTDDDERFESLAELDRIPFVGPPEFALLVAFVGGVKPCPFSDEVICRLACSLNPDQVFCSCPLANPKMCDLVCEYIGDLTFCDL